MKGIVAGILFVLLSACRPNGDGLTDAERRVIAAEVDSATGSFQAAERDRDAGRIISHLAPDFYMYNDGVRVGYDSTVANIQRTMPSLLTFEPEWRDIRVHVLGRAGAVVSFVFQDFIVTASNDTMQVQGPTTLVWRRHGSDWLIVYADADHYPVGTAQ